MSNPIIDYATKTLPQTVLAELQAVGAPNPPTHGAIRHWRKKDRGVPARYVHWLAKVVRNNGIQLTEEELHEAYEIAAQTRKVA